MRLQASASVLTTAVFAVASVLMVTIPASAATITVTNNFFGTTLPDDDSGLEPDVTTEFEFDDACSVGCDLTITLTYNALRDPDNGNVDTASKSYSQIMAGVAFDPVGVSFLVDPLNSTVSAEAMVGGGVDQGATFPTSGTTDISGHYGFVGDVAIANVGSHIVSSVGDVQEGGVQYIDVIGVADLLPGDTYSGSEANPPNGNPFATINDATDPTSDTPYSIDSDGAWNQNELTIQLRYSGTLSDISDPTPLFGTDGVAIPEPSTAILFSLGLIGLGWLGNRHA
jgi:hypothetical protein